MFDLAISIQARFRELDVTAHNSAPAWHVAGSTPVSRSNKIDNLAPSEFRACAWLKGSPLNRGTVPFAQTLTGLTAKAERSV